MNKKIKSIHTIAGKIIVLLACCLCFYILYTNHKKAQDSSLNASVEKTNILLFMYNAGFNDALKATAFLDLELKLNGEKKNWDERVDILRKRYNVPVSSDGVEIE